MIQQTETQRRVAALSFARDKVRRELARRKLLHFTTWTMPDYEPSWHHALLAETLDRVRTGEITRLLVFMPPQHGKSELVSRRFPAHCLGLNPDLRIIATSYNDDLAQFNGRAVRRIVRSPEFAALFGNRPTRRTDVANQASYFEIPGHQGSYLGAGIMAGMTGFGYDLGIIDDPVKNSQEADSPAYQKRLIQAWEEVFLTRGRGKATDTRGERIVGVFNRWRHNDLAGHILESAKKSGERWHVLSLPALMDEPVVADEGAILIGGDPRKPSEPGQPLWPERYDQTTLLSRKRKTALSTWNALYQQRPQQSGGSIFLDRWWKYYDDPPIRFDDVWMFWDAAFKLTGTSRVCGIVFGSVGAHTYLLDLVVDHMSYVDSKDAIRAKAKQWPQASLIWIEDKANGPALISELSADIPGIVPWPESGPMPSKVERWNAVTPWCRAGNVHLPAGAPWVDDFRLELQRVPKGLYDDQADAFSGGLLAKHSAVPFPGW